MRKIIAGFAISLDGFIAGPDNEFDWIIVNREIDFAEQMKRFDTYFLGRKTYEFSKQAANLFGSNKVYVFSTTLNTIEKPFRLINKDVIESVEKIKNEDGKDIIIFGGGELFTSFLNLNLVDEISLAIIPVMLGKGIPLVKELNKRTSLTLIDSRTYSNGTVQLNYNVK
ncbi:MAG: dihydrofolate reductase family protein [Bacteroidota bacterium]|nr:dihydrofolate reductase family protein [Bacteroidota bacterium]